MSTSISPSAWVHKHMATSICQQACVHKHRSTSTGPQSYVHLHMSTSICPEVHIYTHMYTHNQITIAYVHTHISILIYIYIYIVRHGYRPRLPSVPYHCSGESSSTPCRALRRMFTPNGVGSLLSWSGGGPRGGGGTHDPGDAFSSDSPGYILPC